MSHTRGCSSSCGNGRFPVCFRFNATDVAGSESLGSSRSTSRSVSMREQRGPYP